MLSRFAGMFIPITTPFRDDELDPRGLATNLEAFAQTDLRGFLVLGSTGEFATLDPEERAEVLEIARESIPSDRTLLFGITAESTSQALSLGRVAQRLGADAVLLAMPVYYSGLIDDEDLYRHYATIADALTIPLMLYNVAMYTRRDLPVETVVRLARHDNIIGMKESGPDPGRHRAVIEEHGNNFAMLTGNAGAVREALDLGYQGAILAVGNMSPGIPCDLWAAHSQGNSALVEAKQEALNRLAAAVKKTGIAGVKKAMDWSGLVGGQPRRPLRQLEDTSITWLKDEIGDLLSDSST